MKPGCYGPSMSGTTPHVRFATAAAAAGLTAADRKRIRLSRRFIAPLMPALIAEVGDWLLRSPGTRRHFEHDGPADPERVAQHLATWLTTLFDVVATDRLPAWLAWTGPVHTRAAGDPRVRVPLDQINALLDVLGDLIQRSIQSSAVPEAHKTAAVESWARLLAVQRAMLA